MLAAQTLIGAPIVLDVCAEQWSAQAPKWMGPGSPHLVDALAGDWSMGPWWCNPPYSSIEAWIDRAARSVLPGAMLVPARTETRWWWRAVAQGMVPVILTPRIQFIDPETREPKPGNPTGSAFLLSHVEGVVPYQHLDLRPWFERYGTGLRAEF